MPDLFDYGVPIPTESSLAGLIFGPIGAELFGWPGDLLYTHPRAARPDRSRWARRAGLRDRATHPDLNRFLAQQGET